MAKNSLVILAKNIKIDKKNVTRLTGLELLSYMRSNSHLIYENNNFSFIQDGTIQVPTSYENCIKSNYIAFSNPRYSGKVFFAWIKKVTYLNDGNTEIEYEVDSWSTWYFHLDFKTCFVNREHVSDDTIGKHTIQENIDVGKIYAESVRVQDMSSQPYVAVLTNYMPTINDGFDYDGISMYNKTMFGSKIVIFPLNSALDLANLISFVKRANNDGRIEDIRDMFWIPYSIIDVSTMVQHQFNLGYALYTYYTIPDTAVPFFEDITFAKPQSFNNYTPKNNKLKCYPYNYLYITNNNGENNILKIEDFSGSNVVLRNMFALSIGGSGILAPRNYKGVSTNIDESIALGKLPTIQWSSDSYTNWLTQNAVNEQNNQLRYVAEQTKNALQLNIGGAVETASNFVLDAMERFYSASLLPQKVSGTNSGDINFSMNQTNYEIWHMRPTLEYLKIIDDFFSRFGYKVNEIKVPNISGRQNWNYVEIGQNETCAFSKTTGDTNFCPQEDLDKINDYLRKGLTIWSNIDNIGNFTLNNNII